MKVWGFTIVLEKCIEIYVEIDSMIISMLQINWHSGIDELSIFIILFAAWMIVTLHVYKWLIFLRRGVLDTTLCDKVCQWFTAGWWFSPGILVSFTNKTYCHDIAEILLKVALNTINLTLLWLEANMQRFEKFILLPYEESNVYFYDQFKFWRSYCPFSLITFQIKICLCSSSSYMLTWNSSKLCLLAYYHHMQNHTSLWQIWNGNVWKSYCPYSLRIFHTKSVACNSYILNEIS